MIEHAPTLTERRITAPTKTQIDAFGRYKPESERSIGVPKVVEDKRLKQLKDSFKKLKSRRFAAIGIDDACKQRYEQSLLLIKGIDLTSTDITMFSIALAKLAEENFSQASGIFLSALINNCTEDRFAIVAKHFEEPVSCIGYRNTKDIMIDGDAGDFVGLDMEGGAIVVNGRAGREIGRGMRNGKIIVNGNAGDTVGRYMEGGEIRLEGDYYLLSDNVRGGSIYHKGKLIVKDGKRLI